ncbi:glycosyltransferase family 32 protein [Trichoderma atroviride IMI 206040]|uniref:Glycosyltransferase family 32 protein n=1 Tax=Hypocrea atroviridis (strain ATCC 20476 / IMI 206040) TaxID=452589 RepID=G9NIF1_HYPAI|nr:glycosyltransferase family 32 protein [Trichoderma atroviride IMI 206040]EHK49766.1 glycosyltransferase family 32 protein [Trichoderma atroviride IMI 206040]
MHLSEKTDSFSPLRQMLHHVSSQRRYRSYAAAGIALMLLSMVWLSGNLTGSNSSQRWLDEAASKRVPLWPTKITGTNHTHLVSPNIWQIVLPKTQPYPGDADHVHVDPRQLEHAASWIATNPGYQYSLVGHNDGNEFIKRHFSHNPKIADIYHNLTNVGMKSDMLRYLLLDAFGGVYTDTDTVAIRPVDVWIPEQFRGKARLVVGIEFDRRDGGPWADIPHWLQFCQWTIAAAPGHPVFGKMIDRIIASVEDLSIVYGAPVNKLKPGSFEVMNSTGPAAWTDVVFEQLQQYNPILNDTQDLSFMEEPTLIGDILILPIDGFGMGQVHSASTNDGSIPEGAMMKHLFTGSWRDEE